MVVKHTPLKTTGTKPTNSSCQKCDAPDTSDMVQCDLCDNWFHFACVGVTSEINSLPWECEKCVELQTERRQWESSHKDKLPAQDSSAAFLNVTLPPSNVHTCDDRHNLNNTSNGARAQCSSNHNDNNQNELDDERKSLSSAAQTQSRCPTRSSQASKLAMKVQFLEEEVKLKEEELKIQQEIIRLKQKVNKQKCGLLEHASRKSESVSSHGTSQSKKVIDWLHESEKSERVELDAKRQNNCKSQDANHIPVTSNNIHTAEHAPRSTPVTKNYVQTLTMNEIAARNVVAKDLPCFSGNPTDWPMFISMYENTNAQCKYTNVENMVRLQRCLKGQALDAVKFQLFHPDLVDEVIDTLRMRFGRAEQIVANLVDNIRRQPTLKDDNLHGIIKYSLSVKNLSATLIASRLYDQIYNPTLVQEIIDRLPPQLRLQWSMNKRAHHIQNDVVELSAWLYEIAQAANDVSPLMISDSNKTHSKAHVNVTQLSQKPEKKNEQPSKCKVCEKVWHQIEDCQKFMSASRNQRWDMIKKTNICKHCLKDNHHWSRCRNKRSCDVDNCKIRHHPLLHNPNWEKSSEKETKENETTETKVVSAYVNQNRKVFFRIVPIKVRGVNGYIDTFAFLDDGSSITLIDSDLADKLQLEGEPQFLCLKWTGNESRLEKNSKRVMFDVLTCENKTFTLNNVRTVSKLALPPQTVDVKTLQGDYGHLRRLPIQSYKNAIPQILIGLDHWNLAIPLQVKQGESEGPIATKTKLGWIIGGPTGEPNNVHVEFANFHQCECSKQNNGDLTDLVKSYYADESYGVNPNVSVGESHEERRAREILQSTTRLVGDRFETGLLWRSDDSNLPDSYPMAVRRLKCLESQMTKDPTLRQKLQEQIDDYIDKGYVRKLQPNELSQGPRTWFLPIFVAKNPNKPQKVRMVFDAAATVHNLSLNKMLLKGPDQMSSLLGILYRSREKPVVVGGDIRQMFHRVLIKPDDQDSQRFLWRQSEDEPLQQYVMRAMTFGATCSPASAQYVKNHNALEQAREYPHTYEAITRNHYVDDWFQSVDTAEEAVQLFKDVRTVHKKAGFELHSIVSNSQEVLEAIGDKTVATQKMFKSESQAEKMLGLWWDTTTDEFKFRINKVRIDESILNGRRPSKREVLRIQMSMFDPIGLISNFLIYVKLLMQDIWRSGIDWDEPIPDTEYDKWEVWINLLPSIENVSIPRSYFGKFKSTEVKSIQLHVFVDSSEKAYGAVAYLRFMTPDGIRCSLVGSKSKIAPLKPISIPRLELQAAVIGIRLANTIYKEHSITIEKKFMWTDSKTVYCWLQSDPSKYKQYVALRISEILESSEPSRWRWISTKLNVADEITKWRGSSTVSDSTRWYSGPPFLMEPDTEWPGENLKSETREELSFIMLHDDTKIISMSVGNDVTVNITHFSKWNKLLRAQALFMRSCYNFLSFRKGSPNSAAKGPLKQEELEKAEQVLYRVAQKNCFTDEINRITSHRPLSKSSQLYHLTPIIDNNNILRHEGRIDAIEDVLIKERKPVILPRDHPITKLIVLDYHERFFHMNAESVVNELRQLYYITRLRVLLRQIIRDNCQLCKIRTAQPKPPKMSQLPPARLNVRMRPFTTTGVDFFGPLEVVLGRRVEKRYGVIFTCMTTRAVHIEVANSLNTDSCILALRNFIHRRGRPTTILSDNGTNFVGTKNELERELSRVTASWAASYPTIRWKFNTPSAPHMGGAWERQVRSIKANLHRVLPSRRTTDEVLRSFLIEIENIINSRPLVYVPLDHESDEALTPNHFLLGSSNGHAPPGEFDLKDLQLRKAWKISQVLANQFWEKWIREYLPSISRRTKWYEPSSPIKSGDIVMIVDDHVRNSWTRGIVIDTMVSPDGQVRSVVVKTAKGIYSRPAVKVAVLNVGRVQDTKAMKNNEVTSTKDDDDLTEVEIPSDIIVNDIAVNGRRMLTEFPHEIPVIIRKWNSQ